MSPTQKQFSLNGVASRKQIPMRNDVAKHILLGSDTVQVCTGVMKFSYEHAKPMSEPTLEFVEKYKFETHADLVMRQAERESAQKPPPRRLSRATVTEAEMISCNNPQRWRANVSMEENRSLR